MLGHAVKLRSLKTWLIYRSRHVTDDLAAASRRPFALAANCY